MKINSISILQTKDVLILDKQDLKQVKGGNDLSETSDSINGGADIDAVIVD